MVLSDVNMSGWFSRAACPELVEGESRSLPRAESRGAESRDPEGTDRLDPMWYALPVLQLVGILASAFALATAPSNDGGVRSVDSIGPNVDRVFAGLNRPDAPGCAVGFFQAGQILYARGYGSAKESP